MTTNATPEPNGDRAAVHGIGGVFFRSADPGATRDWYQRHLGIAIDSYGTSFGWRREQSPDELGHTVWSPFADDTDYFGSPDQQFMINLRVDDLDAMLDQLRADGVQVLDEIEKQPFGRFAHFVDNDGRRVELWEPDDGEYRKAADVITPS